MNTYHAQIKKRLRNRLDIFTMATYDLLFQHPLKYHRHKTLPLTSETDIHLVSKAGLDKILQKEKEKLLRVGLSTNLKFL